MGEFPSKQTLKFRLVLVIEEQVQKVHASSQST
jgi:hypothetical protein